MIDRVYLVEHFFEIDGEEICNFCGCYVNYDDALNSVDIELDNFDDLTITSYMCVDDEIDDDTVVFEIRFLLNNQIESLKITKTSSEFYTTIWRK